MIDDPRAEKINKVLEKWDLKDYQVELYLNQAFIALAEKMVAHFVRTDGGHFMRGPKDAMVALRILTPWEF
jgi:hypothetical protein